MGVVETAPSSFHQMWNIRNEENFSCCIVWVDGFVDEVFSLSGMQLKKRLFAETPSHIQKSTLNFTVTSRMKWPSIIWGTTSAVTPAVEKAANGNFKF